MRTESYAFEEGLNRLKAISESATSDYRSELYNLHASFGISDVEELVAALVMRGDDYSTEHKAWASKFDTSWFPPTVVSFNLPYGFVEEVVNYVPGTDEQRVLLQSGLQTFVDKYRLESYLFNEEFANTANELTSARMSTYYCAADCWYSKREMEILLSFDEPLEVLAKCMLKLGNKNPIEYILKHEEELKSE